MNIITIKNTKKRKESEIQKKSVIDYAVTLGYVVYKIKSTNKNGVPDVLLLKNEKAIFIEVKSENGVLTCQQQARIKEITDQNICVAVVHSDLEAKCFIDQLEFISNDC